MPVGSLMKITGAMKYDGKLVRVVENLPSNKVRVRLEESGEIIRIPRWCLSQADIVTRAASRAPEGAAQFKVKKTKLLT